MEPLDLLDEVKRIAGHLGDLKLLAGSHLCRIRAIVPRLTRAELDDTASNRAITLRRLLQEAIRDGADHSVSVTQRRAWNALQLVYVDDYPLREAAERLKVCRRTVQRDLHNGEELLATYLFAAYYEPDSAGSWQRHTA